MKKFFILTILLTGCYNSNDNKLVFKTVKEIDYTYDSGWKDVYSIKINSDGSCIVGDGRWTVNYYTGQLSNENIQNLDSLIQRIPFKQYDSIYYEDVVDQSFYKFILVNTNKDTVIKFVYGKTAPKLLNDFSNHLRLLKERLKLTARDTAIDFISRRNFVR